MSKWLQRNRGPLLVLGTVGMGFWAHTIYQGIQSQKSHNAIFRGVIVHLPSHTTASQSFLDHA